MDPDDADDTVCVFKNEVADGIEIFSMNSDGSGVTQLTDNAADEGHAAWSADGSRIALSPDRDGDEKVYIMAADGTNQQRLTKSSVPNRAPTWAHTRPHPRTVTASSASPFWIASTTSWPSITLPKTVCQPLRCGCGACSG
jgi:hypothetical protein